MPIQRIVVYADAAPKTPMRATPTALRRWAEVTSSRPWASVGVVEFMDGRLSVAPLAIGDGEGLERSEVGRAIRTTPRKDIMPATCSLRVKGWWRRIEQAQQATMGARKVITVASERGRYSRESLG